MMRSLKLALAVGLLSLGSVAQAALMSYTVNGVDLVLDGQGLTWTADANLFKTQYDADNTVVDQILDAVPTITDANGTRNIVAGDFIAPVGAMNWWGAMAWTQWLGMTNYGGASDWRLPVAPQPDATCDEQVDLGGGFPLQGFGYNCTGSELGHLFYVEGMLSADQLITADPPGILDDYFTNLDTVFFWSGTELAPNPDRAFSFEGASGFQQIETKEFLDFGWAVRPGQVAAAPLPGTAVLMLLGLFGLGARGWKRRSTLALR